jgi:hypothetical protein
MSERTDDFAPPRDDVTTAENAARRAAADRDLTDREVTLRQGDVRADEDSGMHLLPDEVVADLRPRWADIQASFVDAPRRAVEEADKLVADATRRLTDAFSDARADLEREWDRGEEVSTEDLRIAFRRYRTFFDRLLDV